MRYSRILEELDTLKFIQAVIGLNNKRARKYDKLVAELYRLNR